MYSPKIKEDLITRMYQIKQKTGKPLTKQVNEAIREYVKKFSHLLSEDAAETNA